MNGDRHHASLVITIAICAFLILLMAVGTFSCGAKTNNIGFEINEPMYGIITGKVLGVQPDGSSKTVLVEVEGFRPPTGLKNNPYKDKTIPKGTQLKIEWVVGAAPVFGRWYIMPAEFTKAAGGTKVTLKGSAMEIPSPSPSSSGP